MKIPRKIKKGLKKSLLSTIESNWVTSEIRIDGIEKNSRYRFTHPTFKGITIKSYRLLRN